MNKSCLANLIFFILITNGINQAEAQGYDKRKVEYGFRIGVNVSNMNFNKGVPTPMYHVDASWKTGILFGILLNVPVGGDFSIQPEYSFSQSGGEWKDLGKAYKMNYLSLPLVFKYTLGRKVSIHAGPQFDLLLNSKEKSAGKTLNITHDTEERGFGALAGINYKIVKHLNISLRYIHGLNHVGIGQRSNPLEFKYELIQISGNIFL